MQAEIVVENNVLAIALTDEEGKYKRLNSESHAEKTLKAVIPTFGTNTVSEVYIEHIEWLKRQSWLKISAAAKEIINRGEREKWPKFYITEW